MTKSKQQPEVAWDSPEAFPASLKITHFSKSVAELRTFLTKVVKEGGLVLFTGLSGTGKSHTALKAMGKPDRWILAEDYGHNDAKGHWVLDVPEERYEKAAVFTGMGHNIWEQFRKFVDWKVEHKQCKFICIVYVFPDPMIYSKANALKAAVETPHSSYFRAQSGLSPAAIRRTLLRNFELFSKWAIALAAVHELRAENAVYLNHFDGSEIVKAWAEKGSEKGLLKKGGNHEQ